MGKLLGLFFLLAAICGIFFSIGYSLGRSTEREQALNDQPAAVASTASAPETARAGENKPSAVVAVKAEAEPATQEQPASSNPQTLTFYKAVQQTSDISPSSAKEAEAAPAAKMPASSEPAPVVIAKSTPPPTVTPASAPMANHAAPVTGPGTIVVQIAAVSREDDAVALAGALRKKNYNVFVVNNPITNDRFYHVQVGPFTTMQEAEAMKAKLTSEGYNPIIKR